MDLEKRLQELRECREGAHMPHIYYGDPTMAFSRKLILTLADRGADMIEYGIPFSDPTSDGATFQSACERALNSGVTPEHCLEGIQKLRRDGLDIPILVTTYYNILYVAGISNFMMKLKNVGVQGIIVPNLPIEEADELIEAGERLGVHVIMLVAPTTTDNRLKRIVDRSSGFLYIMNVEGVTGVRESMGASTLKQVQRVRKFTDIPLMAGFGISRREHARAVTQAGADGIVVGSAYAKIYEQYLRNPEESLPKISKLASELKTGSIEGYRIR